MKTKILLLLFLFYGVLGHGQVTNKIVADTVRMYQTAGGSSELIIENRTRNLEGAFLRNRGNGRTEFAYALDSIAWDNNYLYFRKGKTIYAIPKGGSSRDSLIRRNDSLIYLKNGDEISLGTYLTKNTETLINNYINSSFFADIDYHIEGSDTLGVVLKSKSGQILGVIQTRNPGQEQALNTYINSSFFADIDYQIEGTDTVGVVFKSKSGQILGIIQTRQPGPTQQFISAIKSKNSQLIVTDTAGVYSLALNVPTSGNATGTQLVLATDTRLTDARTPTAHTQAWNTITGTPTTLNGYGITDAFTQTQADARYPLLSGSYVNPSWLSSLPWSKLTGVPSSFTPSAHMQPWSTITGTPTTIAGYGITDAFNEAQADARYPAIQRFLDTAYALRSAIVTTTTGGTSNDHSHSNKALLDLINQNVSTTGTPGFSGLTVNGASTFNHTITQLRPAQSSTGETLQTWGVADAAERAGMYNISTANSRFAFGMFASNITNATNNAFRFTALLGPGRDSVGGSDVFTIRVANSDNGSVSGNQTDVVNRGLFSVGNATGDYYLRVLPTGNTAARGLLYIPQTAAPTGTNGLVYYNNSISDFQFYKGGWRTPLLDDGTGKYGIGTAVPAARLEVYGASIGEYMRVGGGTTADRSLRLSNYNVAGWTGVGHELHAPHSDGALSFATAGSERMRITATGYVGVGTAAPYRPLSIIDPLSAKGLEIKHYESHASYNGVVLEGIDRSGNNTQVDMNYFLGVGGNHKFFTAGGERMRVDYQGRVGIGTTAPDAKLHVQGNLVVQSDNGRVIIDHNVNENRIWSTTPGFTAYKHLGFYANNEASLYLNTNGNVGIGTTVPSYKLDVANTLRVGAQGGNDFTLITGGAGYGSSIHQLNTGGNTTNLFSGSGNSYITAGNFGVGVGAPVYKLDVANSMRVGGQGGNDFTLITGGGGFGSSIHQLNAGGNTVNLFSGFGNSYITAGYFGIGTNSPSQMLDVRDGNIRLGVTAAASYLGIGNQLITGAAAADLALRSDAGAVVISSGATERMRVNSNGKVGINNSNPSSMLTLTDGNGTLYLDGGTITSSRSDGLFIYNANALRFTTGGSGGSDRLYISSAGEVAIGTVTSSTYGGYRLTVDNGPAKITDLGGPGTAPVWAASDGRLVRGSAGGVNFTFQQVAGNGGGATYVTLTNTQYYYRLPVIYAGPSYVTLPLASSHSGKMIILQTVGSVAWTVDFETQPLYNGNGVAVSTLTANSMYTLISDGTYWHITAKT